MTNYRWGGYLLVAMGLLNLRYQTGEPGVLTHSLIILIPGAIILADRIGILFTTTRPTAWALVLTEHQKAAMPLHNLLRRSANNGLIQQPVMKNTCFGFTMPPGAKK